MCALLAVTATAGLGLLGCMKVPGEVQTQFAPKSALEDSHFTRRTGAPLAHTFLTSADMKADLNVGDAGHKAPPVAAKETYGLPTAEELEIEHQNNLSALGVVAAPAVQTPATPRAAKEPANESSDHGGGAK